MHGGQIAPLYSGDRFRPTVQTPEDLLRRLRNKRLFKLGRRHGLVDVDRRSDNGTGRGRRGMCGCHRELARVQHHRSAAGREGHLTGRSDVRDTAHGSIGPHDEIRPLRCGKSRRRSHDELGPLPSENAAHQGSQFALCQLECDTADIHAGVIRMFRNLHDAVLTDGQQRIVLKQNFRSSLVLGLNDIMGDDFIRHTDP